MRIEARGKINWTLAVLGQRPDGYHLLDMLMQPITLADVITLEKAETLSLRIPGQTGLSAGPDNLVLRAARCQQEAAGCGLGAAMTLEKHIPMQAGLGGGSADAAAVLAGLNVLWGCGLSREELERLGLTLGADVPFCLRGGLCRVGGIGEALQSLGPGPSWPLVVLQPCGGLSTGAVFRAWHEAGGESPVHTEETLQALRAGDAARLPAHPGNDLEAVSAAIRPEIRVACMALEENGACCAQMSGSGSAVFGVFASEETRDRAWESLRRRWPQAHRCETCGEPLRFL